MTTSADQVRLRTSHPGTVALDSGTVSSFDISISPMFPGWVVNAEIESVADSGSCLSPDQLLIRSSSTGGDFLPLSDPQVVLSNEFFEPVVESRIELAVSDQSQLPPGDYSALLRLTPRSPVEPPGGGGGDVALEGGGHQIQLRLEIQPYMQLIVESAHMRFNALAGPGRYDADQPVRFRVTTNTSRWLVACEPAIENLSGKDDWPVPMDRIHWRLETDGEWGFEAEGTLAEWTVLLEGGRLVSNMEAEVEFWIDITNEDPPGDYGLVVNLYGITNE